MNGFSPDGFIADQDFFDDYSYRSLRANINGCGPIAVYNVYHALGQTPELAEIFREMEGLHIAQRPGPTTMRVMRLYLAAHLPAMLEHPGRDEAFAAARRSRMGILRYSEDGIPHFISFFRQGAAYRFFNVNDGLEDYVCSMEMFFDTHVDRLHYVSAFTLDDGPAGEATEADG